MKNNQIKVLFVDDETEFLETLMKRMKKRGIDVNGVSNGEEAFTFLSKKQADIVVMDFQMPGMDGLQALRKIKKHHPLVEVIMLTGHACMESAIKGMERGAFDYLVKPIDIDELLFKMEDAYDKINIHDKKITRLEEVADSVS